MANPLAVFRKYQKILLVVFGVALMLVFTVGEIISQYMYRGNQATENPVVVTVDSDEFRESDLQSLQFARYHLRNFMQAVNLYATQAGATPQQDIGIPDNDAEASLVQTAILARQAQEMGMVVSDEAIINYLTRYSQGKLAPGDFARILRDVTQGRMSQNQFFDAMRRELLAQQYLRVQLEGMLPSTPAGMWEYFLRLNRKISFEAVPFEVEDYLSKVPEPTEEQILATYEEGKDRYPIPERPDPGFKQLKRVAIQYVKADLNDFLEEAKAQITAEQVRTYYEENKKDFPKFDLPGLEGSTTPGDDGSWTTHPAPADSPAAPTNQEGAETSEPNREAPSAEAPQSESPEDELPGSEADEQPAPADDSPETGFHRGRAPEAQLSTAPQFSTLEVAAQEPPGADSPEATEPAGSDVTPQEAAADETSEPVDAPPDDAPPDDAAADAADDAADAVDEADPLADLPEAAGDNLPDAPTEYQSLEEASDAIRTRLAAPIAREKMDQALNVLRSEMKSYASQYLAWEVSGETETTPPPTPPNLQSLAEQQRLTLRTIPLITIFELQETDPVTNEPVYEISSAYDMNFVPFERYMFSDDLRRYEVRSILGQLRDTEYLYWKTDEVPERVLELNEVRDEVVRKLKMNAALELARKEAEQAAEQLNQQQQRPRDVYASDPNRKVIDAESVTWMTSMSLPSLPPRLTQIPGIEHPGDDFMQNVFSLAPGKAGVAVNNPQDTVYVVYVNRVESDEEQLRQQFLRTGTTMQTAQLAQREAQQHLQQWYRSLEKELGVKWHRDARPDSRSR